MSSHQLSRTGIPFDFLKSFPLCCMPINNALSLRKPMIKQRQSFRLQKGERFRLFPHCYPFLSFPHNWRPGELKQVALSKQLVGQELKHKTWLFLILVQGQSQNQLVILLTFQMQMSPFSSFLHCAEHKYVPKRCLLDKLTI